MSTKNRTTLKTMTASLLGAALLSTALGGTAMAYDHDGNRYEGRYNHIYKDKNFGKNIGKLRADLRRSGYYVMDVEPVSDSRINVYAKKNNQPYKLKYTYPGLKLISSDKKEWSIIWDDRKHHGDHHDKNDIEETIKNESRYPKIKQRAIKKLNNMGYQVEDIEIDEKNGKGVFEIEATNSGQDYEVILGYPNLNIIKLERD